MDYGAKLHEPIYPLAYAATLAGLDATTARRWMRGYSYKHNGKQKQSAPILHLPLSSVGAVAELTFEELLTLRLVRAFREKGLGLLTIRKASQVAAARYGIGNPFVTKAFRSDGRAVFLDLTQNGQVRGEERVLVEALTGQQQFRDVVEPSLFKDVVFVGDIPGQWFPIGKKRHIVIRPDRAFGAPHVEETGVRTDVLADAVTAEGGGEAAIRSTASWFSLTEEQVRAATQAEMEWRTRAAS